ncbi:hypothetical protein CAS74_001638 [Pichia kudriavzevii]|uniref:Signal peptidase complex subunit 2 n=2 Tax=Pichia kudriavzevii TaxID=4909 RepID=A0A099P391_PICKU|nr:uncharacterized protein C5L36_0A04310 [Pichia kudriavzevii]AWU73832.1 hypothetical protein C5L36_0A04310 [Pichia kudriavzevii]KGK38764.1 hypothetical protein JL09_g2144 [Pichia kudriavzevii]ONH76675.1 Signal peptidase complex subunit SPC2 [Pichia kudriavzevii]OUT23320.1 hypothetical protein CAS74_001638 [Pichia kudriavzevii]
MEFKKVPLYSVPALKGECDVHIADVFGSLGYEESFGLMDTKLIIGYTSVAIAGLMYYLEKQYKNDFTNAEYVYYLQILVGFFFTLQGILYLFSKFIERDIKYRGTKKGKTVTVSTSTKSKTNVNYKMDIEIDHKHHECVFPLNEVFFDDGYLSMDAFKEKIVTFVGSIDKSK